MVYSLSQLRTSLIGLFAELFTLGLYVSLALTHLFICLLVQYTFKLNVRLHRLIS
jgi:hypothetical protein